MLPSDGVARLNDGRRRSADAPPPAAGSRHRASPVLWLAVALVLVGLALTLVVGPVAVGQATLNGLVGAGYFALGAVGLTLVFGILRLVNFAHGDFLTTGAYVTLGVAAAGLPFWTAAIAGIIAMAAIALLLDRIVWSPLRQAGTSTLQSFLVAIGLALVLRYTV